MGEESIFFKYIRATLKKWVGFQVAIDEGMGGLYAREKEMWLGTEIEKYFNTYNDVKPDELEEYVGIMINNEFDVLFEDGSLLEICRLFCRAYNMPEDAPIFQMLKAMPAASSTASNSFLNGEASTDIKTAVAADIVKIPEDNIAIRLAALEIKDSNQQPTENEGWTVVNRKHNKQTDLKNRSTKSN